MILRPAAAVFLSAFAVAALELPAQFSDHAVLQADRPIRIHGRAAAGATVSLQLDSVGTQLVAAANGDWCAEFPPRPASASPLALEVREGATRRTITNLVVGEVWLCTGQSNMRFMLKQTTDSGGAGEVDDGLRLLNFVPDYGPATTASNYFRCAGWQSASPSSCADFSAVGLHFGRRLRRELGVPVGLLFNAVGGAPIESFLPAPTGANWLDDPALPQWCRDRARQEMTAARNAGFHVYAPGALREAGFVRLQPFALRGVLWYQGESNASDVPLQTARDPAPYGEQFTRLVGEWRSAWEDPHLAVLTVQLPGLNRDWEQFREEQARLARTIPGVGMAVTIDVGHPTDVHPRNKSPVGERLARLALNGVYGRTIEASGPRAAGFAFTGAAVSVRFEHADGLSTRDGRDPVGFELAATDRVFRPAKARIGHGSVLLTADGVASPVAVRYAWADDPSNNLVNGAGLPAEPWRSDDWATVRIACIGDSITFGLGLSNRMVESYPARLQAQLGGAFDVREFGDSGRGIVKRSMRGNEPRAYLFRPAFSNAVAFEPDVVVSLLGINDLQDWPKFGATDFVRDYRALIQRIKALPSHPTVLVACPLAPLYPGQKFHGSPDVAHINDAIAEAARAEGVVTFDLFTPLAGHPEWFPDHLHPNAAGARVISEVVRSNVVAAAGKRRQEDMRNVPH